MNQTAISRQVGEIHVAKMHFRVISKYPQYSRDEALKIKREMRQELYLIFKAYR